MNRVDIISGSHHPVRAGGYHFDPVVADRLHLERHALQADQLVTLNKIIQLHAGDFPTAQQCRPVAIDPGGRHLVGMMRRKVHDRRFNHDHHIRFEKRQIPGHGDLPETDNENRRRHHGERKTTAASFKNFGHGKVSETDSEKFTAGKTPAAPDDPTRDLRPRKPDSIRRCVPVTPPAGSGHAGTSSRCGGVSARASCAWSMPNGRAL